MRPFLSPSPHPRKRQERLKNDPQPGRDLESERFAAFKVGDNVDLTGRGSRLAERIRR